MRINFNYKNIFTTSAAFGEKPRRAQYFEGPYEPALFRLLEMSTAVIDYQFQPLQMIWTTASGETVTYTTDAIYATETGEIHIEEVKANQAYFDEPETADLLRRFETEVEKTGAHFHRRSGRELSKRIFWRSVKDAFDDRRTEFCEGDVASAQEAIVREGGAAPLGIVIQALRVPSRQARAILNAMMMRRLVTFDLRRPPMADTLVSIPTAPTDPDALRNFLRRFTVQL